MLVHLVSAILVGADVLAHNLVRPRTIHGDCLGDTPVPGPVGRVPAPFGDGLVPYSSAGALGVGHDHLVFPAHHPTLVGDVLIQVQAIVVLGVGANHPDHPEPSLAVAINYLPWLVHHSLVEIPGYWSGTPGGSSNKHIVSGAGVD